MGDGQGAGATSASVTADAQFSASRILRPLPNFEELYQGTDATNSLAPLAVSRPVAFFSPEALKNGGRDQDAGKSGFDPNLLGYMPVPMGALMKVGIPVFTNFNPAQPTLNAQAYRYILHWRQADINRYTRDLSGQYHLPRQAPGAVDTSPPPGGGPRFVTPSFDSAILINQPEPGGFSGQDVDVRREYWVVKAGEPAFFPFLRPADGSPGTVDGIYQQGIADPAAVGDFATQSSFVELETECKGDSLLITCDRFGIDGVQPSPPDPWDFAATGRDFGFSNVYGTAQLATPHPAFTEVGLYINFGTAP